MAIELQATTPYGNPTNVDIGDRYLAPQSSIICVKKVVILLYTISKE